MTPGQFNSWLDAMGISGAEAGRRLGVGPNSITRYRRDGGSMMLGLACAALYHRLDEPIQRQSPRANALGLVIERAERAADKLRKAEK